MTSDLIDDLNADSLDIVEITMSVEEYFGIEIPDNKIETMRTVGDIVFYVDSII
jgi:acyl carrier protein